MVVVTVAMPISAAAGTSSACRRCPGLPVARPSFGEHPAAYRTYMHASLWVHPVYSTTCTTTRKHPLLGLAAGATPMSAI